eukprot:14868166-Alexandrium_andersonii.AAC.1
MPVAAARSANEGARRPIRRPCSAIQSAARAATGSVSAFMRPRCRMCHPCLHSSGRACPMADPT